MSRSLFDDSEPPSLAAQLAPILRSWAQRGVYFGGSSWKYPGWVGSVYSRDRYQTRGKFSKSKFESTCLTEYAETFPAVGGDFTFYQFPTASTWEKIFAGIPPQFTFGLKVPESITVLQWPGHDRYGERAGRKNESFLDAELFKSAFLKPLEKYRGHVASLIFEFGTFGRKEFAGANDFAPLLDTFLGELPRGLNYSVEIRNQNFLGPDYFSILARHNVAHVFNAWTRMPPVAEQIAMPGAFTADHIVVRALLRQGRSYEAAVSLFEPYEAIQEPDLSTREAIRQIAIKAVKEKRKAYVFVNNRLEGHAPGTIAAIAADGETL